MADPIPTKEKRDENLSKLQSAMKEFADKEIKRLDNETKFMRAVMKGRTGSEKLGTSNLLETAKLVQDEIDQFLLFEEAE